MNFSYWEQDTFLSKIDVLIVGSGIVGLNAAITIKEAKPNANVVVVERGMLPSGASTKNAGFACFGSVSELLDDLHTMNEAAVCTILKKRFQGLERLKSRVGTATMDYKAYGNYEVFGEKDEAFFERCRKAIPELNQMLASAVGVQDIFSVRDDALIEQGLTAAKHLIWNKAEGQIHTGKMMQALLKLAAKHGVLCLNGVEVNNFEDTGSKVVVGLKNGQTLEAKQVLVATNGLTKTLFPSLDLKPARNQVLITKPIKDLTLKGAFHYDEGYVYFRNIENRILLGGGRNQSPELETTADFGTTELIQEHLKGILRDLILPKQSVEIEYWWSGILGVGAQKTPIVKMIAPRIGVAVRMGGMGVAIGSLIGEEGARMLLEA